MNHNNIEKAITNIDSKYVMEALDYKNKQHHNSGYFKTIGKVAACFALICILSVSGTLVAAAAGNETAFQVVYEMFPDIAMNLVPVNETCEDNGIKIMVCDAETIEICQDKEKFNKFCFVCFHDYSPSNSLTQRA